jgi:MFS family permease
VLRSPSGLPAALWKLCWISFLLDVAAEMVYPLIPLFVAANLGAPAVALGVIEGAADALQSLATAVTGRASDRAGRRVPYIRWGYALAALSKPLIGWATTWGWVLGLRLTDRLGKGIRTAARDAMIVDLAGPDRRGEAFGLHRAMDTAGAFTGVACALVLIHFLPGQYRTIFGLTAIPGLAAVALVFTLRESERERPHESAAPRSLVRELPRSFWITAAVLWLFSLANSTDAFLLLRAREMGFGDRAVVLAYGWFTLVYALVSWPAGRWSDRVGRRWVLGLGWSTYALVYAGLALSGGQWLWVWFAGYGCVMGLTHGVAKAWVSDFAPPHARGTALGVYHMGNGLAIFASSTITGWVWDARGSHSALLVCSATAAAAVLALRAVPLRERIPHDG